MNWWQRLVLVLGGGAGGAGLGAAQGAQGATSALQAGRIAGGMELGELNLPMMTETGTAFFDTCVAGAALSGAIGGMIVAIGVIVAASVLSDNQPSVPTEPADAGVDPEMGTGTGTTTTTNLDGSTTTTAPDGTTITVSTDPDGTTTTVINTPPTSQPGDDDTTGGSGKGQPPVDNPQPGEDGTDPVMME